MSQPDPPVTLDKVFLISGITVSALVIIVYIVFLIPIIFNKTKLSYLSFLKSHLIICSIICQTYLILYSLGLLDTFNNCIIIVIARTLSMFPIMCNSTFMTINLDDIRFKGYAFQIEMKYTTYKCGFKIKEVPVIFINRELGTSKMSGGIFSEAMFGVMRLRWDGWFKKYPKPLN